LFGKRSDQPRTSEDRARAAADRAARRSAGRPLPPEAFEDTVRPPGVEARADFPVQREPEPVEQAPFVEPPAPRREAAPPREPAPREEPAPRSAATPDVTPPVEAPAPDATAEDGARLEAASMAARREPEPAEAPAPREPEPERPISDHLHQPTVEYTPFQTEEHEAAPADEPERLVPRAAQTATAEPAVYEVPEPEPEPREPKPLRPAPPRDTPEAATPRKRPAPNAPRRRRRTPPPPGRGGGTPTSGGGKGRWRGRVVALIVLVLLVGLAYIANGVFQPFHGDPGENVRVSIPENSDAGQVGDILAEAGVVDSARFFVYNATVNGSRGDLRPGDYTLKKDMSNEEAISALTKVPEKPTAVPTVELTLVEGPSRRENAPVVDKSKKVTGEYAKASGSKATLARIRELGAPKGTKTAEGFLFPATYTLPEGSSANDLVADQLDAFEENFKGIDMSYAKRKNLSRYDVLIIASLIEREAQLAKERRLVSAVIYNRLGEGIPLGIDATTRYSTNNWTRSIKQSELDKDEPFNTRLNRGLPPTPIGNPGLASLKAAAKPSSKKYLYYVRKQNDDSGEHAFSTTYEQFQKDLARYNESRESG
jgi:uncharacterized YceG family protein